MSRLLAELGHPERQLRGALVGGTNGKGSVVAMARSVLTGAGLRVGTMPKPHLVSYRERIAIDGEPVSEARFAAAIARVLPAVDRVAVEIGPPTEFEALTAAAYAELANSGIDVALVEVGMGGRLDATNSADLGVAVIVNVQHDHEAHLGHTLALIGGEKAAIIKRGDLAVTGASGRGLRPISDRCAALDVPLLRAGPRQPYRAAVRHLGWEGTVVDARTPDGELHDLSLGLLGAHQASNAAVTLALLDALRQRDPRWSVDEPTLRAGLASAHWAGRMEVLDHPRHGRVVLDGAHNPAGAAALAATLAALGVRGAPLVFGAMRGKDVGGVLRALAPLAPRPVFTAVQDPGAHSPADLLRAWRRIGPGGAAAPDPAAALARAADLRRGDEPVVVAGSLYLVGALRGALAGEREDA
ncbi:MAG TPA: Mur ligase family protein [Candidatus Limnocylindria bacterium]|nr:Mur ligase family protein [Candidatus Limnocylindria bacterium]